MFLNSQCRHFKTCHKMSLFPACVQWLFYNTLRSCCLSCFSLAGTKYYDLYTFQRKAFTGGGFHDCRSLESTTTIMRSIAIGKQAWHMSSNKKSTSDPQLIGKECVLTGRTWAPET